MPVDSRQLLCPQTLMATAKPDKGPSPGGDLGKPTAKVRRVKGAIVQFLAIVTKTASKMHK